MDHPRVVVCSIRPEIILPLRMAFADVGVACIDVHSTDDALMAIAGADVPPAVVVDQCDFDAEAISLLDQVRAYDDDVPVLLLGVDGCAIDSQAVAFESGGAGYFKLPVDVGKVVAKLSVYLGCALPEIRGAELPGFRVHGTDDLPQPPSLDDVPLSAEGEPTSLFDLDRSDIDRDALEDSFDGDHVIERDLGGGSFSANRSDASRQTRDDDDSDEHDVFSSSTSGVDVDPDASDEVTRPLNTIQAADRRQDDDEPQEAADIRERVARLRRSQQAKARATDDDDRGGHDDAESIASDAAPPTTQIGDSLDVSSETPVHTRAPLSAEQAKETSDIVALRSDLSPSEEADLFEEGTQVIRRDDDDIGSALEDMADDASGNGSTPLPLTMFDQDVTRPPEAEDALVAAVEEAHRGADPYAQGQLDDDGMMSALDEAQASVQRYALERTQDGDPIDDDKTPESGEAALDEDVLEHARMLAEEEARAQAEQRLAEEARLREAEAEIERVAEQAAQQAAEKERQARLAAERQRIEEEARAQAAEKVAAQLEKERQAHEAAREEQRQATAEQQRQEAERLAAEEAAELERVREEALKAAFEEANARLEEEKARLQAEAETEAEALQQQRRAQQEQEQKRKEEHESEKQRLIQEAKDRADAELAEKLAAERERLEQERENAKAKAEALAKEREQLDADARAAFDAEKARLAAEIEAQAAQELDEKLTSERAQAKAVEEQAQARFLAERKADEDRQAEREAEERERIANEVRAEEREKMERTLAEARAAFDAEQLQQQQAHDAQAKARAEEHAKALEAIRQSAADAVRAEVQTETQALLEREQQEAQAKRVAAEQERQRRDIEWEAEQKTAIATAAAEAAALAREQAQAEAERLLGAARQAIASENEERTKTEAIALAQAREKLQADQEEAKREAEQRVRDEVFARMQREQEAALQEAETATATALEMLRQEHAAEQERIEREHAEALEREKDLMLAAFETQLREEREAKEQLRLAREQEYRKRIADEAAAMRAAHEEAMRLASEEAAKLAAERLAAEQEQSLKEQEAKDQQLKDQVAYRTGLFGGTAPLDVSTADLDIVGSEGWVEGQLASALQGGERFGEAGAAPLAPPDVPLTYIAMEPSEADFEDGELGAVLFSATFLNVTGAIKVTHPDGRERTLYFEDGSPVAMASVLPADRAEEHLLRAGLITTARYDELRAGPALSARRLCALLVTEGTLHSDELFSAVRGVLSEQVLSVLEWEQGHYAFFEERCHPGDRVRLSSPFDHLVAEGLRRKYADDRLWRVLGGPATILAPDTRALRLPPLGPQEKAALALFDGARSLEDVVLESGATPVVAMRAALIAVSCGAAKVAARGLGQSAMAKAPVDDNRETDRARILDRLQIARHGDYFSFLGVTEHATAYEVAQAADRLRHRFNPERYVAPALADLRQALQEIREVIDDAESVLGDDDLRASYRLHHIQ